MKKKKTLKKKKKAQLTGISIIYQITYLEPFKASGS